MCGRHFSEEREFFLGVVMVVYLDPRHRFFVVVVAGGVCAGFKPLISRINVILFKNFFWSLDCISVRCRRSKKAQSQL